MSSVPANGANVATVTLTRDSVSEVLQLMVLADPTSALIQSVTPPGTSGTNAAAIQGVSGGVPIPVTISTFSSTAVLTQVAAATSNTVLLNANTARKGIVIVNTGTGTLYVAFAASASTTVFTYLVGPGSTLEPATNYQGAVSGIWSATGGDAVITEMS